MKNWLLPSDNPHGEWSRWDILRDYRICSFNEGIHGGVHVHPRSGAPAQTSIPIRGAAEAESLMIWYAARHKVFDLTAFLEEVESWKSA